MIEFRILGSLEAVLEGSPLALGGPKQRTLLAVLLVYRGEPVSSDRLIDALWGEHAPPSAPKLVQGYVSHLRKSLGDGLLVTRGRGYLLRLQHSQTDVDCFESLVADGRRALRDGDARSAAARLQEALELWRGPALADFADEPFAQAEIARLDESRVAALGERIDADLALGAHARLIGELEALVREHPLSERLSGQLMLALYRSGRQADALDRFRIARDRLVEELGLEPGGELAQLQRAILTHDPALDAPAGETARAPRASARRGRRGRRLIVAGTTVVLAVLIVAAVRLAASGSRIVRVAPNSLAAIDTRSDRIVGSVAVGARPGAVAFGSGSLWVANVEDRTVSRIDPGTLRTLGNIHMAGPPTSIATTADGVWVVESNLSPDLTPSSSSVLLTRVDPDFNAPHAAARIGNVVPSGPGAVAAQGDSVWVAPSTGLLTRVDAKTGKVVQPRRDPNASPSGIAVGEGAIWLTDSEANNVVRIDPRGLQTPIAVGNEPTGITVGAGGVWVVDSLDDELVRIDPDTRSVKARIAVGRSPTAVAVGAGSIWVANSGDGTVTRIDPRTDRPQATIVLGGSPQAITIAGGRAWVTIDAQTIAPTPDRSSGATLRVDSSVDVESMDPALAYDALSDQFTRATCAQLVYYPDEAGPAGSQPTPEVAQALPARSPDGRTYTFTIRPGFRFSPPSNQPVTAHTFEASIERTLNPRMRSPSADSLADVVGARAYMAGRARHIAGVVARADTLTVRLLAPAPDFLARIAQPAFCAVAPNTPIKASGVQGVIPAAGPYYVASSIPRQGVVLIRNPNYHASRPAHFARIELAVGISARRAAREIAAGAADYTQIRSGTTLASQLAARYGPGSPAAAHARQQYFVNPAAQLDFFFLNTHRRLFRDARMRQAVNYALDRRALAALGSGFQALPEPPADHYLPPGMAGFRDARVYPTTPDVATARALAHGGGRTAVLYTCDTVPCPEQAQIVKTDLAAIGIRVQVKTFPTASLFSREARPDEPFDLAYDGWIPDYIDPAAMLNQLLEDASIGPPFENRRYQRRLAAAARLSGPERYLTYGQLDLDLARNAAPLAAFGNASSHAFFSARIGCQTNGIYGIDLAALCIKPARR